MLNRDIAYYGMTETMNSLYKKGKSGELGSSKIFLCPECGYEIDRDINAAMNIFIACERKEITL